MRFFRCRKAAANETESGGAAEKGGRPVRKTYGIGKISAAD